MKNTIKILLVTIMSMSLILTGCGLLPGGGAVKLEEGQMHMIFTEDGELTMIGFIEDKDIEDDFDVDFDDDEDDILDDMQDYMEDSLEELAEMMDLDLDVEITELKIKGDFALVTIELSDFELMFMGSWYEKFEDLADAMGDYEELADEITFKTFKKGDEVDEDDLEDYEDGFTIMLDGSDEGTYYEFPGDIQIVDEDMKYERISDTIIFVEEGEEGFVVVDAEIDGEVFDLFGDLGDIDLGDLDIEDLEDLEDLDLGDLDLGDLDLGDLDLGDLSGGGIAVAGNPNNLEVGQSYIVYNTDGSYSKSSNLEADDYEWEIEAEFAASESQMHDDIIAYYDGWYGITVDVTKVVKDSNSVSFTFVTDDISSIDYTYNYILDDHALDYGGYDQLFESYKFVDFDTRIPLSSSAELEKIGSNQATFIDDADEGAYFTFPGDILVVDGYMNWVQVDSRTIYIDEWSYGIVVFED